MGTSGNEQNDKPPLNNIPNEINQRVDAVIDEFRRSLSAFELADQAALNIAEKLTVLDGGTLALTFTVVGVIGSRFAPGHSALHIEHLYRAWWFLGSSMVGCIISQWLGLRCLIYTSSHANLGLSKFQSLRLQNALKCTPSSTESASTTFDAIYIGAIRGAKLSDWYRRGFHLILFLAQAATVAGFLLLLFFIQANSGVLMTGTK
jgi:hypothetical protein